MSVILVVLSLVSLVACNPGIESVNFDFGWRFYKESGEGNCKGNPFPQNLSDVECIGLQKSDAKSAADCFKACCSQSSCLIWQYANSQGCWIGQSNDCQHPNKDWVGGGRKAPITPPSPKQAAKDYDDSSWEVVDVPHDGLINGTYDQNGLKMHGYLPMVTVWYRKHFNLPSDWKGQSIWIEFRGVFRASYIYFNGQKLLYHDSGYTTFLVRLDNASMVNYGDGTDNENVIAVEANAGDSYSGWWYEGGGIYRHTWLFTTNHVHLVQCL